MKVAIWSVFGVLAVFWTAGAWVTAELTRAAAQVLASGAAVDLGQAVANWPVPSWLSLWADPAWIQFVQGVTLWSVESLGGSLPFVGSALGWLVPLVWIAWAAGAAVLLGIAGLAHWLSGRGHAFARRQLEGLRGS